VEKEHAVEDGAENGAAQSEQQEVGPTVVNPGPAPSRGLGEGRDRRSFYYHYSEQTTHHVAPHRGVRTARYTLAHYYETDEWELFDLQKDPRQMRSVYADPAYAPAVTELKADLSRLRRELRDEA
jgi:arylsulfatase A-like enzyme